MFVHAGTAAPPHKSQSSISLALRWLLTWPDAAIRQTTHSGPAMGRTRTYFFPLLSPPAEGPVALLYLSALGAPLVKTSKRSDFRLVPGPLLLSLCLIIKRDACIGRALPLRSVPRGAHVSIPANQLAILVFASSCAVTPKQACIWMYI